MTAKYTQELNDTIEEYQNQNRTADNEIEILIKVSNSTSTSEFNKTVSEINKTGERIRFVFTDQRIIATTAEPDQIRTIAAIETVERIRVDSKTKPE